MVAWAAMTGLWRMRSRCSLSRTKRVTRVFSRTRTPISRYVAEVRTSVKRHLCVYSRAHHNPHKQVCQYTCVHVIYICVYVIYMRVRDVYVCMWYLCVYVICVYVIYMHVCDVYISHMHVCDVYVCMWYVWVYVIYMRVCDIYVACISVLACANPHKQVCNCLPLSVFLCMYVCVWVGVRVRCLLYTSPSPRD